jgi:hypothetical protein
VVIFVTTPKIDDFGGVSKMCKFVHFGGTPEMCKNRPFWGVHFGPQIWGYRIVKNPFRGTQLYGDTRQIIYCLDTRYGPPKRCFWAKNVVPAKTGGFGKTVFLHVFRTFRNLGAFLCNSQNDQKWVYLRYIIYMYIIYHIYLLLYIHDL